MILDRQCLHGGWNYGNRLVYGAELRPMPENTGLALDALKGLTPRSSLESSLDYLKSRVQSLRTPIALTLSLLGLGAWGERPAAAPAWLAAARDAAAWTASVSPPSLRCGSMTSECPT